MTGDSWLVAFSTCCCGAVAPLRAPFHHHGSEFEQVNGAGFGAKMAFELSRLARLVIRVQVIKESDQVF